MATTPPLQTPTWHAACPGRTQQFQTDSYGTCRQRHESHARRFRVQVPRLQRETKVDVSKCHATQSAATCRQVPRLPARCHTCHACHAKWKSMCPSITPATQTAAAPTAPNRNQAHHQSQPNAISATPATQSDGGCHQVPRLPRKVKVHVAKCHACHTNSRGAHGAKQEPSAPPEPAQCHKCHACRTKWRWMSSSATPATQSEGPCHQVPRLPHKVKVDVTKCHTCHAKWRSMSPSDTPATQRRWMSPSATPAAPATQSEGRCDQVPCLPHKVKVDVTKCHACHAKWRWMSPSAAPATPSATHACATSATQSDGGCKMCKLCVSKLTCE